MLTMARSWWEEGRVFRMEHCVPSLSPSCRRRRKEREVRSEEWREGSEREGRGREREKEREVRHGRFERRKTFFFSVILTTQISLDVSRERRI